MRGAIELVTTLSSVMLWGAAVAIAGGGGPAFTYQGQLRQDGVPANGSFDFRFSLRTTQLGIVLPPPECRLGVTVVNGLFTTDVAFPPGTFVGPGFSLQVAVKTAGGVVDCNSNTLPDPFTNLGAPQPIQPTPYAIHALSAANGHGLDAADGSPTNALVVDGIGNVGIGTTIPSRQLEVSSPGETEIGVRSSDTNGRLWTLQSSGVSGAVTDATFQIVDRTAGASRLTIDTVGNVGVGTTAPEGRLHVRQGSAGVVTANANSTVVMEDSGNSYLTLLTPDAGESGILFGSPDNAQNGGVIFNNGAAADGLQFRTGGNTTWMTLDRTGALLLNNSVLLPTVRLDPDDGGAAAFVLTNSAGANTVVLDGEADDTPAADGGRVSVRNGTGRETVEIDADETGAAALRLSRGSGGATISMGAATSEIVLADAQGDAGVVLDGEDTPSDSHAGGRITVRDDVGRVRVTIDGDGTTEEGRGGSVLLRDSQDLNRIKLLGVNGSIECVDLTAFGTIQGTVITETSTRSMKSDVRPIADALARLVRLNGVEFTWDECVGGRRDIGLIAEDVAEVLPELVRFEADGITAKGMNYTHLTALIVEAVKELTKEKNEQLCELRAEVERQIATKNSELEELKRAVLELQRQAAASSSSKEGRMDP